MLKYIRLPFFSAALFIALGMILNLFPVQNVLAQSKLETPQFFSALEDIPLMPGLRELPDETFYFDKPEGRIIETVADMNGIRPDQVLTYYQMTLPQLGWGKTSENSFFRNKEFLEIQFETSKAQNIVKLMVKPML